MREEQINAIFEHFTSSSEDVSASTSNAEEGLALVIQERIRKSYKNSKENFFHKVAATFEQEGEHNEK